MNKLSNTLSRRVIERDRDRATKFLAAVGRSARIFGALQSKAGYSAEIHKEGWRLLLGSLGQTRSVVEEQPRVDAQEQAIAQLDNWDGPAFTRARAALKHRFPQHEEFLFSGLNQGDGAEAVHTVQSFLDRIQALREAPEGESPVANSDTDQDRAVLALLEARKIIDAEIEAQLRGWIDIATQSIPMPMPVVEENPEEERLEEAARALGPPGAAARAAGAALELLARKGTSPSL